jgi:SAM-dependent methyltransferase
MEARAVAVVTARQTQLAFDGVAATYDRSNAENSILRAMRARTRAALIRAVPPEGRVLDLGCGPGTDVVHFAAMGFHVTAVDWSTAMVAEARRRVRDAGLSSRARVLHLDIEQIDRLDLSPPGSLSDLVRFDAAYSSFGPLNCVTDLPLAARALAGQVRAGGWLIASVIGRVCPWEFAVYAGRADIRRALVRFARKPAPVPLEGRTVWTQYYTPAAFGRVFARAGFNMVSCRALGLFVPPPYMHAFADRHPRMIAALQRLEDTTGSWRGVRMFGDHFLVVMRRA